MELAGRYELIEPPIGTGSFGSVYMANDLKMPRRVAVKILHAHHAYNDVVRARFKRELAASCRVSHENVIQVLDVGEDEGVGPYYVMEFVRGTELDARMKSSRISWDSLRRIGSQLAAALDAIHGVGIIHRDLKPQNIILVDRTNQHELVKVLDFGIAAITEEHGPQDMALTGTQMVLGTPAYMSPEQTYMKPDRDKLDIPLDGRSDLYALGVILYEASCGERPFVGDYHELVIAHRTRAPIPLADRPGVTAPVAFTDLVMKLLAKRPDERPESALEVMNLLDEMGGLTARPSTVGSVARSPRGSRVAAGAMGTAVARGNTEETLSISTHRTGPWIVAAVAAGLLVLGGVFWLTRGPNGPSQSIVLDADSAAHGRHASTESESPNEGSKLGGTVQANADMPESAEDTTNDDNSATPDSSVATILDVGPAPADIAAVIPEVPDSKTVTFILTSTPIGAEVLVNGELQGETPMNLTLAADKTVSKTLTLRKKGHTDTSVTLAVGPALAGQAILIQERLEPIAAKPLVSPRARPTRPKTEPKADPKADPKPKPKTDPFKDL